MLKSLGGPSAFESHWQHWTVKRSLCALTVLTRGVHLPLSLNDNIEQWRDHSVLWQCWLGGPSAFESQWQHWTVKRSLCALTVLTWGVHLPLSLNDNIEQRRDHSVLWQCWLGGPSAFESQWQHWTVKRSLCALTVLTGGVHLPLSLNDNIEQWRDHSVLWQCWLGGPSAFESQWQHWTVKRSLCALTVLTGGVHLPLSLNDNIEQRRDHSVLWQCWWGVHLPLSLNDNIEQWRDHSVLWQCWLGGSICLWVSMTTLNSEEITLCSDSVDWGVHLPLSLNDNIEQRRDHSVLWQCWLGGVHLPLSLNDNIEQWRDHSVLWQCWLGGSICLWVSMTTLNREEITLCSDSVDWGSICLWVSMTTLNSEEITLCSDSVDWGVHLPLSLNDNIEQWRDHSVLWQCWLGGVHLPLSLNDNIEQWRDHSVLWQCWLGGPSAFESQWQHWTVKRSPCALTVLNGGSICLWVSMTTLNSEEITLCSDSVDWGVHLPLSLNDNIEQRKDHSVLWQCWAGGSICLWCLYLYICTGISLYFLISWLFKMGSHLHHWTTKSSLYALAVLNRGGPSAFGVCIFIYALVFPYIFLLVDCFEWALIYVIEQQKVHSVLWQFWTGGRVCLNTSSAKFDLPDI